MTLPGDNEDDGSEYFRALDRHDNQPCPPHWFGEVAALDDVCQRCGMTNQAVQESALPLRPSVPPLLTTLINMQRASRRIE